MTIHERASAWRFLALALAASWACFWAAAFVPSASVILHYAGGLMPTVVVIILLFTLHDRAFRRDFASRLLDPKRIRLGWWIIILLFFPAKTLIAGLVDTAFGGAGAAFEATWLLERPAMILPMLVFWLLFGPLPEEIGWRGYALGGLQRGHSAFIASLIIGVVWSLWHLPLYFIEGTYQAEQVGLLTTRFWLFTGGTLFEPILYTWIFNNTRASTLSAVLFHFAGNAGGELVDLSLRAETISFGISLVVIVIVIACSGKGLCRANLLRRR
jgi:uncharacterized protein